jgi:hypothetical protein
VADRIMEVTPDCCSVWPRIVRRFGWFGIDDQPEIRLMPYIASGGHNWRVNYCPSCGAERTGVVNSAEALEVANAAAD